MNKAATRLYTKLKSKGYYPRNICEVGVFLPEQSNLLGFIFDDVKTTLVEAHPEYVIKIRDYFSERNNITVIEAAVCDFKGKVELIKRESSTFISQLKSSPALINDNYKIDDKDKFIADSILFSEIDSGNFDVLSIDIEGAEWYVIKYMVSRPEVISIETHGKYYTNPFISEIKEWMVKNNYLQWYKDGSDTVYIKGGVFSISFIERVQLCFKDISISLLKRKRILKKLFNVK
jgi:FkbM family methyltransferase